jgi:hypothetical protein
VVAYPYHPSYTGGGSRRTAKFEASLGKVRKTLPQKQTKKGNKRSGDMAQMVQHLPSRCKALGLIPRTAKNNKIRLMIGRAWERWE